MKDHVPILILFFSGADLKPAVRLSGMLVHLLPRQNTMDGAVKLRC